MITEEEIWTRYYAAAISDHQDPRSRALQSANEGLEEHLKRWPDRAETVSLSEAGRQYTLGMQAALDAVVSAVEHEGRPAGMSHDKFAKLCATLGVKPPGTP